jgi:GNAT superfamily N-acetyltransferase
MMQPQPAAHGHSRTQLPLDHAFAYRYEGAPVHRYEHASATAAATAIFPARVTALFSGTVRDNAKSPRARTAVSDRHRKHGYGVALLRVDSIPASSAARRSSGNKSSYQLTSWPEHLPGIPLQLGNGTYTLTVTNWLREPSYTPN